MAYAPSSHPLAYHLEHSQFASMQRLMLWNFLPFFFFLAVLPLHALQKNSYLGGQGRPSLSDDTESMALLDASQHPFAG